MDDIFNYKRSDEEDFYNILGCDERSTTEQIIAEYKARVLAVHPDKNPTSPAAVEKFHLLQKARDVLTDDESRKFYDMWRNSGLAVSYKQWITMKKSVRLSMHWAVKTNSQPMLEDRMQPEGASVSMDTSLRDDNASRSNPDRFSWSGPSSAFSSYRGTSGVEHWNNEPPSETLRKFRNYEI
ncbi:J domain-containing protein-like [Saccoglossus kowalevskii]|uniref:DnaJ homolog subfamily C member 12-like n=1 Tax=Saccoglossus kowalevskii TaxID=10224 RepID=A0ABM0GJ13_SACKO|nr:PREDICTED: dnaJ homolog subfamily C member 12-like [Saccoglossus kowalevskii]